MAGLGGKNWSFEEEVTSSDVNGFLADQVVMRFADEATRTAGFGGSGEPTLAEGMVSYLDDSNTLSVYNGSVWEVYRKAQAGQILQVVSTTKTDTFTTTSSSLVDVTGLSATITPSSSSSLIFVQVMMYGGCTSTGGGVGNHVALLRGATQIALGNAAGNRFRAFSSLSHNPDTQFLGSLGGAFLDSPATTSATTYKIQVRTSSGTFAINRNGNDADLIAQPRTISTITLMEVTA